MENKFEDQVAVVTGAASGLGMAIALKMSQKGIKLALFDKNWDGLGKTREQLVGNNEIYLLDITNEGEVSDTVGKAYKQFERIDILINCAEITGTTNLLSHEVDSDNFRKVFDVNLMCSFFTSKYVLSWMVDKNYERILHIASISGKEVNAGMPCVLLTKNCCDRYD